MNEQKVFGLNIYDRWGCDREVRQVAFPFAVETSSSHIGGIRIKAINRDFPDWFVGLSLGIDSNISKDKHHHIRYVYVKGNTIDIEEIRRKFLELRQYLIEPYQKIDLIWECEMSRYW